MEHGCPIFPSVQKLSKEPFAQLPALQSVSVAQCSPTAPELHLPPDAALAQLRPLAHSVVVEQELPALPSLQVPLLDPANDLPHNMLLHSLPSRHGEPTAPSLQTPKLSELEATIQIPVLQSFPVAHSAPS